MSEKKRLPALLLCFFFGCIGVHRFYVGKVGTGILFILTLGIFGIGVIVDLIAIISGVFRDIKGKMLKDWT